MAMANAILVKENAIISVKIKTKLADG